LTPSRKPPDSFLLLAIAPDPRDNPEIFTHRCSLYRSPKGFKEDFA
jgi:hypothetical protein